MALKSNHLISGLAVIATMMVALPAAQGIGIGASTKQLPVISVNRAAKGDRIAFQSIAVKKGPSEVARDSARVPVQSVKPKLMDGCDPMFSPVTVPSMAHLAGRCVS